MPMEGKSATLHDLDTRKAVMQSKVHGKNSGWEEDIQSICT